MNATNLTKVKQAIRNIHEEEALALLDEVMKLDGCDAILQRLEAFLIGKGLAGFIHARLG